MESYKKQSVQVETLKTLEDLPLEHNLQVKPTLHASFTALNEKNVE